MKYRRIDGALHNLGHSFVSYTNYVDDGFVIDDLIAALRNEGVSCVEIVTAPMSRPVIGCVMGAPVQTASR